MALMAASAFSYSGRSNRLKTLLFPEIYIIILPFSYPLLPPSSLQCNLCNKVNFAIYYGFDSGISFLLQQKKRQAENLPLLSLPLFASSSSYFPPPSFLQCNFCNNVNFAMALTGSSYSRRSARLKTSPYPHFLYLHHDLYVFPPSLPLLFLTFPLPSSSIHWKRRQAWNLPFSHFLQWTDLPSSLTLLPNPSPYLFHSLLWICPHLLFLFLIFPFNWFPRANKYEGNSCCVHSPICHPP